MASIVEDSSIAAKYPHFSKIVLSNDSSAEEIYPVVWHAGENSRIWDDPNNLQIRVPPHERRVIDVRTQSSGKIRNGTNVYLGVGVVNRPGEPVRPADPTVILTYIETSPELARGNYGENDKYKTVDQKGLDLAENGEYYPPPPPVSHQSSNPAANNLVSSLSASNTPAVAKLLTSLAQLISPDL